MTLYFVMRAVVVCAFFNFTLLCRKGLVQVCPSNKIQLVRKRKKKKEEKRKKKKVSSKFMYKAIGHAEGWTKHGIRDTREVHPKTHSKRAWKHEF